LLNIRQGLCSTGKIQHSIMADVEAKASKDGSEERITPLLSEKRQWYHSTFFNACIIGGVGFLAPGLWNAMNSLGILLLLLRVTLFVLRCILGVPI
jgi:hypothetical protein